MGQKSGADKGRDKEEQPHPDGHPREVTLCASKRGQGRRHQQLHSPLLGNEPQKPQSHPRKTPQRQQVRQALKGTVAATQRRDPKSRRIHPCPAHRKAQKIEAERSERERQEQNSKGTLVLAAGREHNSILSGEHWSRGAGVSL